MATAKEIAIAAQKKAYDVAKAAKNQQGMIDAKKEADRIRGYETVADGSAPLNAPKPVPVKSTPIVGIPQSTPPARGPGSAYQPVVPIQPLVPLATDFTADIQKMYQQLLQGQTAALKSQTDKAVSDYNQQIEAAPGTFQPLRNEVDVNTARSIQGQNEVAAAKGTAFSGGVASNISGTENTGTGLKTALNQQEVNVVQSIKKAISDTKNAAGLKELELIGTTNANMLGATIDEKRRVQAQNYQASRDQVSDTRYNEQMAKDEARYQQEIAATEAKGKSDIAQRQQELDYQKYRDEVADGKWLKNLQVDEANAKAGRAVQWANLALDKKKFDWSLDPKNPQNILQGESKAYSETYKRMWDAIQSTKKGDVDETGSPVEKSRYSNDEIYNMIMSSGLSLPETTKMVQSLGVKVPNTFWKSILK